MAWPLNLVEYAYNAEDVQRWMAGKHSGIYGQEGNYQVVVKSGRTITVKAEGMIGGWLSNMGKYGIGFWNDLDIDLEVALGDGYNPRIDRVVVSWYIPQQSTLPTVTIRQGTPAASPVAPAIVNDGEYAEICLAEISVPAGMTEVATGMIHDTRLDDDLCGLVSMGIEKIPVDGLTAEYMAWLDYVKEEYNTWFAATKQAWNTWYADTQEDWGTWYSDTQDDWDTWYAATTQAWTTWYNATQNDWNTWYTSTKQSWNTWYTETQGDWDTWFAATKQSFTNFIAEKDSEFDQFISEKDSEFDQFIASKDAEFDQWTAGKDEEFDYWFESVKGKLDGDAGGNMANDIFDLEQNFAQYFDYLASIYNVEAAESQNESGLYTMTITLTDSTQTVKATEVVVENADGTVTDTITINGIPGLDPFVRVWTENEEAGTIEGVFQNV